MTFALFLYLARSCDSFECFFRSHLLFSKEASILGDLFRMIFVNLFESPSSFSVFRCPYFFLVRESFSCVFCFSQGASFVPFCVIRSLTHPRRSPEPGWPSCHSWCGSPCHSFHFCFSLSLWAWCGIFSFLLFHFFLFPSFLISKQTFFLFFERSEVSIFLDFLRRNDSEEMRLASSYRCISTVV